MQKYGVNSVLQNSETKQKIKNTMIERYGVENPSQNEEIQTSLQRYGVNHPSQNAEYMDNLAKLSFKLKDYILPTGNIIKIQGYEHFAYNDLLQKENILEEDIINGCKNVPIIWYEDENRIKRRHFVDIFIPSQNRCIEIKSTWTAKKKKDCIFLKQQAGKELGYNYEIWVYNQKGERVECHI